MANRRWIEKEKRNQSGKKNRWKRHFLKFCSKKKSQIVHVCVALSDSWCTMQQHCTAKPKSREWFERKRKKRREQFRRRWCSTLTWLVGQVLHFHPDTLAHIRERPNKGEKLVRLEAAGCLKGKISSWIPPPLHIKRKINRRPCFPVSW